MDSLGIFRGALNSVSMLTLVSCGICCHVAIYGSHDSRVCDTGLGGNVGDTRVSNTRGIVVWLLLIQLTFPSSTLYASVSLCFHIWELMFCKVEGAERMPCLGNRRSKGIWACLVSVLHPQRRGGVRGKTQWNHLRAILRLCSQQN